MTQPQITLWNSLQKFELDHPHSSFTFTHRLARENGWSMHYAIRAVDEYKKFIFLICNSEHPLTPSDQVDQVWHLHLLYTESYWKDLCSRTLGREIQHGPTKGGMQEAEKFTDWYARTLELYRAFFLTAPPIDIWPDPKKRFSDVHFRRVNLRTTWCIRKPLWLQSIRNRIYNLLTRNR